MQGAAVTMADLHTCAVIITAVASALLGLIVCLRAPDRHPNRLFGVHALCVTAWAVVTALVGVQEGGPVLILSLQLAHVTGLAVLVTYVDFAWVFPDRLRPAPPGPRRLLYGSALVVGAFAFLPALVRSAEVRDGLLYVQFGWYLAVMGAYVVTLIVHVCLALWHKVRTLHGIARLQTVYVFSGALVTGTAMALLLVVLPTIVGHGSYTKWGVVAYLAMVTVLAVAIAKHRLWDLSRLERRVAAAVLAVASVAPVAALLVWVISAPDGTFRPAVLTPVTVAIVVGAAIGLCLPPLYHAFRGLLSRALAEDSERISQFLSAVGAAIVHAPTGGATLMPILVETQQFFGAGFVDCYLRGSNGEYRSAGSVNPDAAGPYAGGARRALPSSVVQSLRPADLTAPLEAGDVARFGSMDEAAPILGAMEALGADVVTPLRWQEETIGLLVMGPKLSRDMYGLSELDLLSSVAAHAAIAAKNAELRQLIVAEKERTEKVLTQMESGVVAADANGLIHLVNPAACLLLGKQDRELLGVSAQVLPRQLRAPLEDALRTGATVSGARVRLENGLDHVRVAYSTFVLRGATGRREGAGIVFRDLRTEDALARFEREADQLRFIRAVSAGMAHEIRNPLVAIRTFTELLPTSLDDPEFRESFLQVAQAEVGRLEELVSQFMTLAKPPREVRVQIDVRTLLAGALTTVSAGAQARGITVALDVPPGLPQLHGDDDRLHQALINLLLNALEATPSGGRIELRAREASASNGAPAEVAVTVWNSGSYIPPEDIGRVFEPFFTSKQDGTGLGLAICKTIADEHGGATQVESSPEAGTAFTITLPVMPAPDAPAEAMP